MPGNPATEPTDPPRSDPAVHLPPRLRLRVDLAAVAGRYRAITATATTEEMRRAALASALDVPALVSEVDRLCRALVRSRLRYANLAAAARASLAAAQDEDPEPWEYLRDELSHPTPTEPPTPPPPGPAAGRPGGVRAGGVRSRR